jgi:ketosteroid isomerase-like protein
MLIRIIAATAALALSGQAAAKCTAIGPHPATVLRYVCDSERAWAESVASGDPSAVQRILSEDFIGVDPDGKQYRKAEMIADTVKAGTHFSSNEIGDVIVRFYGNMAVAQGSETWTRKSGEKGRWVWTDTWLRRNGKWQIIAAEDLQAPAK